MTNTSAVFGQVRETDRTDMKHINGRLNSAPTSHLRVRRRGVSQALISQDPPQPAAGEAICSPTPHYLSLFGGRFHSCVHMFPVKQYNQVNQIYMSSVSLKIIFACFYVFVYDRCSIFLINWKGRWHVERHRQVFSWVFPCFPSSSPFPVFSPPTKHFQTPGASIEEWRQLFQYLMCLICFVSIACNHT